MYRNTLAIVGILSMFGCADVDPGGVTDPNETPATSQQHLSPVATTNPVVSPVIGPIKPPRWTFTDTIDFDTDPNGVAVAAGTDISNRYATMGVTFKGTLCDPSCHSAPVYANGPGGNGNNVVALTATSYPGYDNSLGAIEAWFNFPIISASIEVMSDLTPESLNQTPTARPWLEAYDTSGNYLGKTYGTASPGVKQTLSIAYSNIGHVRFGSQRIYPWMYGIFDNLSYTFRLINLMQP
jgi:hypothetical protein